MRAKRFARVVCLLLCGVLCVGTAAPAFAAPADEDICAWSDGLDTLGFTEDWFNWDADVDFGFSKTDIQASDETGNNYAMLQGYGCQLVAWGTNYYDGTWDFYTDTLDQSCGFSMNDTSATFTAVQTATINGVEYTWCGYELTAEASALNMADGRGTPVDARSFSAMAVVDDIIYVVEYCAETSLFNSLFTGWEDALSGVLGRVWYRGTGSQTTPAVPDAPAAPGDVAAVEFSPASGTLGEDICPRLVITFDTPIQQLNYDEGSMYLLDKETGEKVYWLDKNVSGNLRKGRADFRGNKLWWNLPAMYSDSGLQKEHTYYLVIDEDFITFAGTDATYSITGPGVWEYTIGDVYSDSEYSGTFQFSSSGSAKNQLTAQFLFRDDFFEQSSYLYNDALATMSMCMAVASYNYYDVSEGYRNVTALLENCGFGNLQVNQDYKTPPTIGSTGVAFGSKKILGDTTLIAVAIRGGNYDAEWGGNFFVGDSRKTAHVGFDQGRSNVISALQQYVDGLGITGDIKLWVTGYSRGSAIANLTGAALIRGGVLPDSVSYAPEDVYTYCFEVPSSTTDPDAEDDVYACIYNIINPMDLVPRVPLFQWGFGRYGTNMYIPAQGYSSDYTDGLYGEMCRRFETIYPGEAFESIDDQVNQINQAFDFATRVIPDRDTYARTLQDELVLVFGGSEVKDYYQASEDVITVLLTGISNVSREDFLRNPLQHIVSRGLTGYTGYVDPLVNVLGNTGILFKSHYAEVTLAWMQTLQGTGILERSAEPAGRRYDSSYFSTMVQFHCPVAVQVYDSTDTLVASIDENGHIYMAENSPVVASVGADGVKCFRAPSWQNLYFVAQATDDGAMTVSVAGEHVTGQPVRLQNYNDLALNKDESYILTLDTGLTGSDFVADVIDPAGEVLAPSYTAQGLQLPICTVTAAADGAGGAVVGGGSVVQGSFVSLSAKCFEGYRLQKWVLADGSTVKGQDSITLRADGDMTVTACFVPKLLPGAGRLVGIAVPLLAIVTTVFVFARSKKTRAAK